MFKEKKNQWGKGVPPKPPRAQTVKDPHRPAPQCGQQAPKNADIVHAISKNAVKPIQPVANPIQPAGKDIAQPQPDDDPKGDKAAAGKRQKQGRSLKRFQGRLISQPPPLLRSRRPQSPGNQERAAQKPRRRAKNAAGREDSDFKAGMKQWRESLNLRGSLISLGLSRHFFLANQRKKRDRGHA